MPDLDDLAALHDAIERDLRESNDAVFLRGAVHRLRERLATLTTERDQLHDQLEPALRDRAVAIAEFTRVVDEREQVRAERDTAQALLVEEQRDHAATREELRRRRVGEYDEPCGDRVANLVCTKAKGHHVHWNGRTAWQPDEQEAARNSDELERQRPVIEAARAWRAHNGRWTPARDILALIAAVDALGTPTPSEEGGDNTSERQRLHGHDNTPRDTSFSPARETND